MRSTGISKEKIRLYYPLQLFGSFFGTSDDADPDAGASEPPSGGDHREAGRGCCDTQSGRFCFHIPEEGSEVRP